MLHNAKVLRILIIEDEQEEYDLLTDCLMTAQLGTTQIVHALDLDTAKEILLEDSSFDVIFLDLLLDSCSGADCFVRVMDMTDNKLPIIALCEVEAPETTLLALVNGAKHYLIKGSYNEVNVRKVVEDCLLLIKKGAKFFENSHLTSNNELMAICDIDCINHKVKRTGTAFFEFLGYTWQEFNEDYHFWSNNVHPDDKLYVGQMIADSLVDETKRYWEIEYRFRKKDSTYNWIREKGYILCDAESKPVRIVGMLLNIQERKNSESLIRISQEQYASFFTQNPHPAWIYDVQTLRILEANTAASRHYGYQREEFLNLTVPQLRKPGEESFFMNTRKEWRPNNPVRHHQVKHLKKNGEVLFVDITAMDILFDGRKATQVLAVDITAQVNAQNERLFLLEIVEKLRRANSLQNGLRAVLKYGREYIGWDFAEIWLSDYDKESIKLVAYDFDCNLHPERLAFVEGAKNKLIPMAQTVFKRKSKHYNAYWIEDLQTEKLFLRAKIAEQTGLRSGFSVPISFKGHYVAWIIFFHHKNMPKDLALLDFMERICKQLGMEIERRTSEEHLNYMFELSQDLLGMASHKGYFTQVNKAFTQLLGYPQEALIDKPIKRLVHPEDWAILQAALGELKAKQTIPSFELRCIAQDRSIRWISWSMTQIPAEDIIFASGRDITAKKQNDVEREMLIKELTENNRDLKQFSYITSHNLRAPLSNLLGIMDLINPQAVQDPTTLFLLEKFKESTLILNQTVNDLLNILVIKNNVNIEQQLLSLDSVFQKTFNNLAYLQKKVESTLDVDFSAANQIVFNSTYLESIFQNLITNAFKYHSPERVLHIQIYTKKTKEFIKLYFCDNGLGIDLERHGDKVFGLYQRFHHHADSKGLGLYIIHSQIRALGGNIEVQSKVDEGTTFIVSFKRY